MITVVSICVSIEISQGTYRHTGHPTPFSLVQELASTSSLLIFRRGQWVSASYLSCSRSNKPCHRNFWFRDLFTVSPFTIEIKFVWAESKIWKHLIICNSLSILMFSEREAGSPFTHLLCYAVGNFCSSWKVLRFQILLFSSPLLHFVLFPYFQIPFFLLDEWISFMYKNQYLKINCETFIENENNFIWHVF